MLLPQLNPNASQQQQVSQHQHTQSHANNTHILRQQYVQVQQQRALLHKERLLIQQSKQSVHVPVNATASAEQLCKNCLYYNIND